jgi:hypothetical protein
MLKQTESAKHHSSKTLARAKRSAKGPDLVLAQH